MSEVKLKPCPFCGGENIMLDKTKEDTLHLAVCRNCVAQVSGFTRDGAIRAWNTRKPMDDIVERLEEFYDENEFEINSGFIETCIDIAKGGVED